MTSDFRVYKVLDNNGGTAFSGSEPTQNQHLRLHLVDTFSSICIKYLSDASKFNTTDFIPVSTDSTVSASTTDGAIESIVVTGGSGIYRWNLLCTGLYLVMEQIKEHHLVQ